MKLHLHIHFQSMWRDDEILPKCDTPCVVLEVCRPHNPDVKPNEPGGLNDKNNSLGLVLLKDTSETEFVQFTKGVSYKQVDEPVMHSGTATLQERGYESGEALMQDVRAQIGPKLMSLCVKSGNHKVLQKTAEKATPEEVAPALVEACKLEKREAVKTLLPHCTEKAFDEELKEHCLHQRHVFQNDLFDTLLGVDESKKQDIPWEEFIPQVMSPEAHDFAKAYLERQTFQANLPQAHAPVEGQAITSSRKRHL